MDAQSAATSTLPDLLRGRVRAAPDATAVVDGDRSVSVGELARHAEALGGQLRGLGVRPDDCVGVFAEPSLGLMTAAWGVLFSGGAYLPLSPDYPEDRLRYMIEDAGVGIIVTQEALAARLSRLAPPDTRIVTVREVGSAGTDDTADAARSNGHGRYEPQHAGRGELRPHHLAYVIYTSGSTGKPKGVMIEHRSIVSQMRWLASAHGIGADTVILQKTPMSFDAAQWEILAPVNGATVVVGTPGIHRDPELVIETVNRHGVTALQCVPTLLQALIDTEELETCKSLTQVFSGGEVLSRALAGKILGTLPQCELINLYGPTECTINSSSHTVDRDALDNGPDAISIGAPVAATSYHILDAALAPVAPGAVGELYIGGVQLARGYLRRPELTEQRFVPDPFGGPGDRLYRTGDLASWGADGTVQFAGRADNQVKLHGFRVELDEIRLMIENHDWVRSADLVVRDNPRTGFQNLVAFVELDPKEAALMDQGSHGAHHQSKAGRHQVRAQLADPGLRDAADLARRTGVELPGRHATEAQRRLAFARKTYRFYEGGDVSRDDILRLLSAPAPAPQPAAAPRGPGELSAAEFGEILRYFGQFRSGERLLPKYGYASPGSLYATQLYLELHAVGGLGSGFYYYHPAEHRLYLIHAAEPDDPAAAPRARFHLVGRKQAIEPVYKNNIQEVLEIEAGHLIGLLEAVLPGYGLSAGAPVDAAHVKDLLDCAPEDYYLAGCDLLPYAAPPREPVEIYVQAHPHRVRDLPVGQYRYADGALERVSDQLILKKHVIAINQAVYERASLGITVVGTRADSRWHYVDLGRIVQRLEMNGLGLGFMSSGYSSRTGEDLPSARRIEALLADRGTPARPSYFVVGGRVSERQQRSEGMGEDVVHMRGPAEMIKDDLAGFLPEHMVPNRVLVLDRLPLTANGKVDRAALTALADEQAAATGPVVPPRTETEKRIGELWSRLLKVDPVSVVEDFFESGGNSLVSVALVNKVNRIFDTGLPMQIVFDAPTVEALAALVDSAESGGPVQSADGAASRLVALHSPPPPVYCWPGLGGYPMNLRVLARQADLARPFHGVQAHGLNADETPYATIEEMAEHDVAAIKRHQPVGPYTLWGYSFGARVAFEAAYQLEQAGSRVEHLFLIAPGQPIVRAAPRAAMGGHGAYADPAYVTILYSVFAGAIKGPRLEECLRVTRDEESFTSFITTRFPELGRDLVRRIVRIVHLTYYFRYEFHELEHRHVQAPITIFKAQGDDYSFIESHGGYSAEPPTVVELAADHYELLREPGVGELARAIRRRLRDARSPQESRARIAA
jgi:amino acid adenylation domain-containing protein